MKTHYFWMCINFVSTKIYVEIENITKNKILCEDKIRASLHKYFTSSRASQDFLAGDFPLLVTTFFFGGFVLPVWLLSLPGEDSLFFDGASTTMISSSSDGSCFAGVTVTAISGIGFDFLKPGMFSRHLSFSSSFTSNCVD